MGVCRGSVGCLRRRPGFGTGLRSRTIGIKRLIVVACVLPLFAGLAGYWTPGAARIAGSELAGTRERQLRQRLGDLQSDLLDALSGGSARARAALAAKAFNLTAAHALQVGELERQALFADPRVVDVAEDALLRPTLAASLPTLAPDHPRRLPGRQPNRS